MPVLDSEPYHQINTAYILGKIEQLWLEEGHDPKAARVYHFNLYTGGKFLQFESNFDTFDIARKFDFGTVWLVFHQVERGEVLQCANEATSKLYDDCITILWASSDDPSAEQIEAGLNFADDVVRKLETLNGVPCPIPLKRNQLTNDFELACHIPSEDVVEKILIVGDHNHLPQLDGSNGPLMLYLQGYLDDHHEEFKTEPYQIMRLAAEWQRQAIRALGTEEWPSAIVACNTWIEVFAVRMAVAINEILEQPIADLRTELNQGLSKFITKHIGAVVKEGHWDRTRDGTEIKNWYDDCYLLRHRVVHQGYLPTEAEVFKAYNSAHEFIRFLTRSMASIEDQRLDELLVVVRNMRTVTEENAESE